ncbi:unnamed protein product [Closterium sp. NIES-54]
MAKLTAPLTDVLRKGVEYTWGEKDQAAFSALKNMSCSPPVLRIADPHRPFELVTDASDIAVGVVLLLQDFENDIQPIAYKFRKLHPPKRNYPIHDPEMLAIVHAFKVWQCYLTGSKVTIWIDHHGLQYLRAQPNLNPRQIRWLDYLESNFYYTVTCKRGASNIAARYVACGFSQRQGVDFFHTFSPTLKMTTLRVLLHVVAHRDYELHSLDFSTAFLQGSLHEEIWLRRPPGFTGSFPAGTQWSLRRPVYCLRQAPREWHDTLRTTFGALGFAPSTADPSLFLRTDTTLPPFYVLVYVDDLVFATADTEALAHVKSELQKRHTCTDLGELTSYFGLRITRDRAQRTITLTQSHMVQQVLQRFGFTYSSPQSTPLPTGHSLSTPPSDESVEPSGPYPELVGCLMYLMTCTRTDLAYPLSLLARYVAPGRHRKVHWDAAKRVLHYLCNTSGMGLVLGGRARVVLTGHADASSVDDLAYFLTLLVLYSINIYLHAYTC